MRLVLYIALGFGAAMLWMLARRMPRKGPDRSGTVTHDCGTEDWNELKYSNDTYVAIQVLRQCDQYHKVEIEVWRGAYPGRWQPITLGESRVRPDRGATYIVHVPGGKLRLKCPAETPDGTCEFDILKIDPANQPETAKLLSPPEPNGIAIPCNDWKTDEDILVNLSPASFPVSVRWLSVCPDGGPPRIRFKRADLGASSPDYYRPNSQGLEAGPDNTCEADIAPNESLEVICPGGDSDSECKFTVVWRKRPGPL